LQKGQGFKGQDTIRQSVRQSYVQMVQVFSFSALAEADLIVDAVYEGGRKGNSGDDPLGLLVPGAGNQGGFRSVGSWDAPKLAVLYSSMDDADWPDSLDPYTGTFTYFGDNKKPGHELHNTPRRGNAMLKWCFSLLHSTTPDRRRIPPFLVFTRGEKGRDVVFRGLAVPGTKNDPGEDLVALWRSKSGQRFQNYRARFTILDVGVVHREWILAVKAGDPLHSSAPRAWSAWVSNGVAEALRADPVIQYRTPEQQSPAAGRDAALVTCIYEYFMDNPHGFEHCAAALVTLMDSNIHVETVTRPSADGGRDAIGTYRIGPVADRVSLTFALEAKCYAPGSGVGVKGLARLISRLRYREFGILVTTSYLGKQAYEELRSDQHPVIVIAGVDIAAILLDKGMSTPTAVQEWLESSFKKNGDTLGLDG
jgi:hypothetical protein